MDHQPSPLASRAALTALALLGLALHATSAQAQINLGIGSSSASPGGNGAFDVTVTNGGASAQRIAGFSFQLLKPTTPGVTYTGASADPIDVQDDSYIFGTYQSAPFPFASVDSGSGELTASDVDFAAPYINLAAGQTLSLGDVFYTIGSGVAPGSTFQVRFDNSSGGTGLSDENGNAVPATLGSGTITARLSPAAVPEPSSVAAFAVTGLSAAGLILKARRRKVAA